MIVSPQLILLEWKILQKFQYCLKFNSRHAALCMYIFFVECHTYLQIHMRLTHKPWNYMPFVYTVVVSFNIEIHFNLTLFCLFGWKCTLLLLLYNRHCVISVGLFNLQGNCRKSVFSGFTSVQCRNTACDVFAVTPCHHFALHIVSLWTFSSSALSV